MVNGGHLSNKNGKIIHENLVEQKVNVDRLTEKTCDTQVPGPIVNLGPGLVLVLLHPRMSCGATGHS